MLVTVLMLVLCILLYTGQSFFNRLFTEHYTGPAQAATPVFTLCYGLVVCLISLAMNRFRFSPSGITWALGIATGVSVFFYNLGMIKAAQRGPYAFQSIVMLFGNIVGVMIFSSFYWGDRMTAVQFIGIAVMFAAFAIMNLGGMSFSGIKKGYFFWAISLFFSNGVYGILMDSQQRMTTNERTEMVLITFLTASVISAVYLLASQRSRFPSAFRMGRKSLMFLILSACCSGVAVYICLVLLGLIPAAVLYTLLNGGIMALSAVLSAIVLKERFKKKTVIGIAVALISVVLLSI